MTHGNQPTIESAADSIYEMLLYILGAARITAKFYENQRRFKLNHNLMA